ncbi:MAG: ATP-binding protein [Nitrospirota bacterium]
MKESEIKKMIRKQSRHFRKRDRFVFNATPIEEQERIISYMANLIDSREASKSYDDVFEACHRIIGGRRMYEALKPQYGEKLLQLQVDYRDLPDWATNELNPDEQAACVERILRPELDRAVKNPSGRRSREFEFRLQQVREVFLLSDEELAILELFYIIESNKAADILANPPFEMNDFTVLQSIGHKVLGLDRRRFLTALKQGCLFDANLLETDHRGGIGISSSIRDYLIGLGDRELSSEYFDRKSDTSLKLQDFTVLPDDLKVLQSLLRSQGGCNILFYGYPGTGKTSLAGSLAKSLKLDLYNVKASDDEHTADFRIRAIYATLNAAKDRRSIVLVDEADDVLNTRASFLSRTATAKGWVNDILDARQHKIIWITNETGAMDASTMRRFDFALGFDQLRPKQRRSIFQYELKKHGFHKLLTDHEIRELSMRYAVDAGGIVHAVNMLKIRKGTKKESVLRLVEAVLKNHEKAVAGKEPARKPRELRQYTLEGLNASHDLQSIVSAFKEFGEGALKDGPRSVTLLLYGPPGTGKSEFVHYLGTALEKDVLLRQASDIQDCYVGGTEKRIAAAFREAQDDKSILFFDEADTFLFPRKEATHSWEKSFTNELLAQLDNFRGIAVFATNDIEGLDHAAIRRFKFKVRFSALAPEGNLHFYRSLLQPLVPAGTPLTADHIRQIGDLRDLTPGDFAVVKDLFSFGSGATPEHQKLIDALRFELHHKTDHRKVMGFSH